MQLADNNIKAQREPIFEMLMEQLDGILYRHRLDENWTIEFLSEGCLKLTGYTQDELVGNAAFGFKALIHPEDRTHVVSILEQAAASGAPYNLEYRVVGKSGRNTWIWERGAAALEAGKPTKVVHGIVQDITIRHMQEEALREAEQRYRSIFENANEGIFQTTVDGHYLAVNPALVAIYGYDSEEELMHSLKDISKQLYVDSNRREEFLREMSVHNRVTNFESQVYRKDGSVIWISENAHTVLTPECDVAYYEGTIEDISNRKEYEAKIAYQATHDALTGLPNRLLLAQRIEAAILEAETNNSSFGLVYIDLDFFKEINDTLGHAAGDVFIKKVGERLSRTLRGSDTVARIGGDEFVLLLNNVQRDFQVLIKVIERILQIVRKPYTIADREFTIGCSAGISFYPADGMDAETLLKNADIAMYQAKEAGRNQFEFFTPEFNKLVLENHELSHQLRHAINNNLLELYYQPIVSWETRQPVKAEALLRWRKGDNEFVPPSRFIPIAEKCGLIEHLGAWVLNKACAQIAAWKREGIEPIPIAINIAPTQFNQMSLLNLMQSALTRYQIEPGMIEIEITENSLARDKEKFLATLGQIKDMGVKISIDDFGSGYSNMECLKSMLFSSLKIDKSFIDNVSRQKSDRAIYRAMISMAHNLNLTVVAEGVETQQQLMFLKSINCDLIQGYYYSKPLPAPKFAEYCEQARGTIPTLDPIFIPTQENHRTASH